MTTVTSTSSSRTTRPPAPWQLPTLLHELAAADLVASVYVGTRGDVRDGADRVLTRWQEMRCQLRDEGAPESMLVTLDECIRGAPVRGETMAAFASADGRSHVEHLAHSTEERAFLGPLPHVSPVVTTRQREVPVVVVVADRRAADLLLIEPGAHDLVCQVIGEDLLINGSTPDGHHRLLQRVDEQCAANARVISEFLTWLVDCSQARLVVTSGDGGLLHQLRARLDPCIRGLLVGVPASASIEQLTARARVVAADVAAVEEQTVLEEAVAGLPNGRACDGAASTLRAVVGGRAEEVLIAPDQADRHQVRRLSVGVTDSAGPCRSTAGPPAASRALLSDVLIRAAGATSTVVRTVRDGRRLRDGVGALLRGPVAAAPLPPARRGRRGRR